MINLNFINLIEEKQHILANEIGKLGIKLILLMLKNFHKNSFFRLNSGNDFKEINRKFVYLALMITLISQQNLNSQFSCFFFENEEFPLNFPKFFNENWLFGNVYEKYSFKKDKCEIAAESNPEYDSNQTKEDSKEIEMTLTDKQKKGYIFHDVGHSLKKPHISPISDILLHFILHATIFSLSELEILNEHDLQEILRDQNCNGNNYFKEHKPNKF